MRYRTIVADPPWDYADGWGRPPGGHANQYAQRQGIVADLKHRNPLPYPSMTLDEIRALPIRDLADPDGCHVYMWTTNRYLPHAFGIFDAWGVRYGQTLVWCKTPMGNGLGGDYMVSTEYVLFGRIGTLKRLGTRMNSTWWNWPRMDRQHSRKPEAFMDMVETISPDPRLEMFARRARLGWHVWGNEVDSHVELPA